MNPNDPTGLNKVLMQMQPLMLSRTPDFQKFSSPSELGVPVAVGDASRLPSQCPPESSNTKLSKSQQHPKALSFSFTSTHRLPKMSCSIYSPFASMCQHFSGEREKGSLVRRGVFIGYLLSHLSSLHPETSKWISINYQHVINTSLRTIDSHCYVGVLLPWASNAVLSPPRRTLGCANLVRRHCSVSGSISVARFGVHGICDIAWCLCIQICIKHKDLDLLDKENQLRDQVFVADFVYTPGWRQRDRSNSQTWPKRSPRSTARHSKFCVSSRNTDINGLHWLVWCWIIWSSHSFAYLRWSKVELPRIHLPNPSVTSEAQAASEVVSCLGEYLARVVRWFWFLVTCQVRAKDLTQAIDSLTLTLLFEMQRMVTHDPCNYTTCDTCTLPPSWEKRRVWQSRTVSRKICRSMRVYKYILFCRTSGRVTPLYLHIFKPRAPINVFVGVGATDRATCVLSTEHRIRRAKPSWKVLNIKYRMVLVLNMF